MASFSKYIYWREEGSISANARCLLSKVTGLVSIQPFFGGEERTEAEKKMVRSHFISVTRTDWMWRAFLPPPPDGGGAVMNRDHEAINVSGPRAVDLSALDFPATMVVVGGLDPLQDWQRRYYHWLKRCGKEAYLLEYPDMIHAFYVFPELPQAAQLISQVKDFIHKHRG